MHEQSKEEPRPSRHELGARVEYLEYRSNILANAIDEISTLVKFADSLCLDKAKCVLFEGYISAEILDTETELEITKAEYELKL